MRSELFGYVEGAFTGAKEDTKGLLHQADGDTLFLDEIGDVGPDLQRLLIRALEDKQFFRVGARSPEESDFRLITATNRSEEELNERLDADFLDRVSTFSLRMPSLREMPEEIPWLWESVYKEARARSGFGVEPYTLTDKDHSRIADQLTNFALLGNLRDLFRLAYLLISLEEDPEVQAFSDEICRKALEEFTPSSSTPLEDLPREVARRFAEDQSLQDVIIRQEQVPTNQVLTQLKGYFAREIRQFATEQDQNPEQLTDVVDKTLRNWIAATDDQ
jgi:transcriptional regulator with AAA-type ATPase domain